MSDGIPTTPEVTPTATPAPAASPAAEPAAPTDPNSLFASQLAAIKSDDGRQKFATVDKALESVPFNQTHIAEQAARIAELEEQVAQNRGQEALLAQLQSQQPPAENPSPGIDETQLGTMLDQRLDHRERVAAQNVNVTQVLGKLREVYGEQAETRFNEKAASLGMSVGQLSDLAKTSPLAALEFFDTAPAPDSNPTQNSFITNPEPQAPAADQSHMDIFTGGTSGSVARWRDAAAP